MGKITLQQGDALLVADVQNDFLPGGALAVPNSDHIVAAVNDYIDLFRAAGLPVYFSRDWHPPDHCSFRGQGGPWPVHCVQHSQGASFADDLRRPNGCSIVSKATDSSREAYSAFDGTELRALLDAAGVRRLFIAGLTTDYCVKHSALDALHLGLGVAILADAVAAVDVHAGDGLAAMQVMRRSGAVVVRREDLQP